MHRWHSLLNQPRAIVNVNFFILYGNCDCKFCLNLQYLKIFFSVANQLSFGDCAVGIAKKLSFTLTNHLKHDAVRFNWSTPEGITFSPCTGHLLPNCAKDVTAFFVSHKPIKIESQPVLCKVTKIKLPENERKVC